MSGLLTKREDFVSLRIRNTKHGFVLKISVENMASHLLFSSRSYSHTTYVFVCFLRGPLEEESPLGVEVGGISHRRRKRER